MLALPLFEKKHKKMDRIIRMTVSIDDTKLIPTLVKIFGNSEARPIELHLGIALGFLNFPFEYQYTYLISKGRVIFDFNSFYP